MKPSIIAITDFPTQTMPRIILEKQPTKEVNSGSREKLNDESETARAETQPIDDEMELDEVVQPSQGLAESTDAEGPPRTHGRQIPVRTMAERKSDQRDEEAFESANKKQK